MMRSKSTAMKVLVWVSIGVEVARIIVAIRDYRRGESS